MYLLKNKLKIMNRTKVTYFIYQIDLKTLFIIDADLQKSNFHTF